MKLHDKKWSIKNFDSAFNNDEMEKLELNSVVKQILISKGFDTVESINDFLYPDISNLYDPFLLKDMNKVIDRINSAIKNDENIWIYGDYDVDGITSISILMKCFEFLGVKQNYYIPNRLEEGYGISEYGLDNIIDSGAQLIISVDCGITSVKEVQYVKDKGIDIIITDHHNCQDELPDAFAIVNPKQPGCSYPYDMLAGVGIAMKIVQALLGTETFINNYDKFLDIAALGTVADVAPITDENRIITKYGLEVIANTKNVGLKALLEVSELVDKPINAGTIGFKLGPKINAAGRIGKPELGVKLLISNSEADSLEIAKQLDELNKERQNIEKEIIEEIDNLIETQVNIEKDKIFVVLGDAWHTGVIGIVASRISEKYHRPSVILSVDGDVAKGSARSVGDISIFDALNSCKDIFIGFGGHKQAAGLSLYEDNVDELRIRINQYADEHIHSEDLIPNVRIDSIIHNHEITYETIDDLEKLEPHGMGNPKPVFIYNNLSVDNVRMLGKEKDHLKLILHDGNRTFDAIGFGIANKYEDLRAGDKLDMVMTLGKNSFRGIETIQFMIKDVRRLETIHYKTSEIGKCFTKTLARSLYYNSIDGAQFDDKRPSYSFGQTINYLSETVNRLDYVVKTSTLKRLVLVQSFSSMLELTFRIKDKDLSPDDYTIQYNKLAKQSNLDILVNPILNSIEYGDYDEVIVYDLLYSTPSKTIIETKCNGIINYLSDFKNDEKNQLEPLFTALPHRMDLVDIYKVIIEDKGLSITLEDFAYKLKMDIIKCELSLRILENLKLISIDGDDTYHLNMLPKPEKKLALDQTVTYQKIISIRDDFYNYIKELKDNRAI